MFFIYNGYDHIFYLYYTWRDDLFKERSLDIFKRELQLAEQPSWKNSNLKDVDEFCNPGLRMDTNAPYPNAIELFKYSGRGTSLKKCLEKKWMLLHLRDNDLNLRVLSQLLLRGDYEIWNS